MSLKDIVGPQFLLSLSSLLQLNNKEFHSRAHTLCDELPYHRSKGDALNSLGTGTPKSRGNRNLLSL